MKRFVLLAPLAALAAAMPVAAGAVVTVDQSTLIDPALGPLLGSGISTPGSGFVGRYGQMQSVTAGLTGTLTRLDLQLLPQGQGGTPADKFWIELLDGEPGTDGPRVVSARKSFDMADLPTAAASNQGALFSADLSDLGFQVVANTKFSYAITIASDSVGTRGPSVVFGYRAGVDAEGFPIDIGIEYLGGYNTLLQTDGTRLRSGFDRAFRTWVDVAGVPEPETWAMMICGFAAAGVAMRRKRVVSTRLA